MAAIDYFGIEESIKTQIESNLTRQNVSVLIEQDLTYSDGDVVIIYLDRRDAPSDLQTISRGSRQRYEVAISIWCWVFGIEIAEIMHERDDLVGDVENALMQDVDRKFGRTDVEHWRLDGGDFENTRFDSGAFGLGAETRVIARALGTT